MKKQRTFALAQVAALLALSFLSTSLWAAPGDQPAAAAAKPDAAAKAVDDAKPVPTEVTVDPETELGKAKKSAALKKKYQRSRLTNDQSEGLADRRRILLTPGEDRTVDLDFSVRDANGVSVGNPQIVAFTLVKINDRRQIVFKPLKDGETTVTIRDEDGTIRLIFTVIINKTNIMRRKNEISDLLKDIEGLEIKVVGQKLVLDGELLVPADYSRVLGVVSDPSFASLVLNLTTLSPIAIKVLSDRIRQDIQVFAPKVDVRIVNGMLFLEGNVDVKEKAIRAEVLAKLYLPEAVPGNGIIARDPTAKVLAGRPMVQNFIVVDAPAPKKQDKLVRVTVHYVELSKDYNKIFGFKWEPGFTPGSDQLNIGADGTNGSAGSGGISFSATISSLFPRLQNAQDAGFARILKTGTLIVRSGQPAKLVEKTDYPFSRVGTNNQVIGDKTQVGLDFAVTPKILGQTEDIELELDMNQSSVIGDVPSGSAPRTSEHSIKTKIYVKSSESAAVAGITGQDVKTGFNKQDPSKGGFTGNTQPLFTLGHSKSYNKQKNQFVIFVTPQIIENASEGTQDMKRNFRVKVN